MRDKVSEAIAIPKASWGCAPALPNRIRVVFLEELLLGKSPESGSAESLRCLPVCCSPVVALSELHMNVF